MKKFLWTIFIGSLVGAVLFAWLSPQIISWYFTPPSDLAISCAPAVEWGLYTYRKVIFTGALLGLLVSTILFFALRSNRKQGAAQSVPSTAQK